jgi:hypothetical protein
MNNSFVLITHGVSLSALDLISNDDYLHAGVTGLKSVCKVGSMSVRLSFRPCEAEEDAKRLPHNWLATLARFQICSSSGYSDYLKHIKINLPARKHMHWFSLSEPPQDEPLLLEISLCLLVPCPLFM